MKILDFFRSKVIIFIIQIFILSLVLIFFNYNSPINFDSKVSPPQERIIQTIANYVLFRDFSGLIFIYSIWISISFIPIFIYNSFKRAYSMNLLTFFFPNFFVYAFLYNNSINYYKSNFLFHIIPTIFIGLIIVVVSFVGSFFLKKLGKPKIETRIEDLHIIMNQIKSKCPNCGTIFNSTPIYCYKCNSNIIIESEDNIEVE
ncbi:hypothetical protein LCGC14_0697880 [marine sediment metagenome]|uniref:Uncharacterized protein n=1 Tax=marine sediment metagenome TaxID=412755 RepID=A0A0F9QNG5_9ZZZZ|nr:MAG: hypothetical protein Lokiarch_09280 [Candidatus Lokiarchaeum sp. GC14_75]